MASPALAELLALQDIDLAVDQLRHRRSHLPEAAEMARADAELQSLSGEEAETQAALDTVAARQAAAESELAVTEQRAAAVNDRLYGGGVSASKDLQAMSAELEHLRARASTLEDDILALMEEREPLETRLEELRRRQVEIGASRAEAAARFGTACEEIDAELGGLAEQRRAAAGPVPEPLMASYERLRARLGGVAVARLVGNHCDGCHLTLSSAELEQVRRLGDGDIYTCEQCSRILVP
jgi:predicted  nucleic acid-binding Zn-ribbon protein